MESWRKLTRLPIGYYPYTPYYTFPPPDIISQHHSYISLRNAGYPSDTPTTLRYNNTPCSLTSLSGGLRYPVVWCIRCFRRSTTAHPFVQITPAGPLIGRSTMLGKEETPHHSPWISFHTSINITSILMLRTARPIIGLAV